MATKEHQRPTDDAGDDGLSEGEIRHGHRPFAYHGAGCDSARLPR